MPSVTCSDTRTSNRNRQTDTQRAQNANDGLDGCRKGEKTLKNGSRGLDVAAAQKALNQQGYSLKVDGRFGDKTEAAVRDYQRKNNLKVDGKIGPETMGALDGRTASPSTSQAQRQPADPATQRGNRQAARQRDADRRQQVDPQASSRTGSVGNDPPAGATEAQKYDHYQKLIESKGGKFRSEPGQKNIVGLRTETNYKQARRGKYDDKVVMLWKDNNGNKRVREYQANMDPAGSSENRFGQDVNRDGRKDLGRVPEGYHEYKMGLHYGRARRHGRNSLQAKALRPTGTMRVDRDTNHDGKFSANERRNGTASDMLFHSGGVNSTSSAGCQTMPPSVFQRFWNDLSRDGRPGAIGYTVINR
jgi:peptidoglycan hydrolase-like protein with peptidoglycan-binding domain